MDIIADLEGVPAKPPGKPCRISVMRRDRPDLAEQFDKLIHAYRSGARPGDYKDAADWFTANGFTLDPQIIGRHKQRGCTWCGL